MVCFQGFLSCLYKSFNTSLKGKFLAIIIPWLDQFEDFLHRPGLAPSVWHVFHLMSPTCMRKWKYVHLEYT